MWIISICLMLVNVVSAQPGFLSLDCGGKEEFTDPDTGIRWIPDDNYINTGKASSISKEFMDSSRKEYQTLRYFPETLRKHCYKLPVDANGTYLLRATFTYGNYDKLRRSESAVFVDILLGGTLLISANAYNWYYEYFVKAQTSNLTLCLATDSKSPDDVPFVSTIELRKLDNGMYGLSASRVLQLWRRVNLGATSKATLGYPNDQYDRRWHSDLSFSDYKAQYVNVATSLDVSVGDSRDNPPSSVMSTAVSSNSSVIFKFPDFTFQDKALYYFVFYFADIRISSIPPFDFGIALSDENKPSSVQILSIGVDLQRPRVSTQYSVDKPVTLPAGTQFLFVPMNSTGGTILNAAEMFEVLDLNPGTENNDAMAIEDIKAYFNLSHWSGDPCFPQRYSWDWIICDIATARITGLRVG